MAVESPCLSCLLGCSTYVYRHWSPKAKPYEYMLWLKHSNLLKPLIVAKKTNLQVVSDYLGAVPVKRMMRIGRNISRAFC